VSWYQKGKTNLDFTEARGSEWQWHQLGYMQVSTSLQTDNHTTQFLQAGCPSCRPTNSIKALKAATSILGHKQVYCVMELVPKLLSCSLIFFLQDQLSKAEAYRNGDYHVATLSTCVVKEGL